MGLAVLGGVILLSIFAAYAYSIFGRLAIPYEYHAVAAYRRGMQQGVMGIGVPRIDSIWYLTVHPLRGLFFWSPVLLFALAGCLYQIRSRGLARMVGILGLYALVGYLLFNSGYYMWWGGWAMGPRLLLPIFIAFPLGLAYFCQLDRSPVVWGIVAALGIVSIALTLPISLIDPQLPQLFTDAHYRNFRIGDSMKIPALSKLMGFYKVDWLFPDRGPTILRLVSWGAACLIPAVLIPVAIRSLPSREIESRTISRE
jgi:hypothetical protein